ncbi:hypothetical protein NPX13_g2539 [Xylaria arbuscula]|uniref:F-box domain-containing protein n=1 Tax=Xylaria arbuscula TaxID=114810 RepID=A0A9W8NJK1_9PEZI|nr:hypothetical protein NPX13_g2539 [Xylaria arbuscula]
MSSHGPFPPEIVQDIVFYLTHDLRLAPDRFHFRDLELYFDLIKNLQRGYWIEPHLLEERRSWSLVKGACNYATVNRIWQDAVEREIFSELHLDRARLLEVNHILNRSPRRQSYLRTIRLYAKLPPYYDMLRPRMDNTYRPEHARELQATFEAFLSALSHWTSRPPIRLHIGAFTESPLRSFTRPQDFLPVGMEEPDRIMHIEPVEAVTDVDVTWKMQSRTEIPVSCAAVCSLLARLPATRNVSLIFRYSGIRDRDELAKRLEHITHDIDCFKIEAYGWPAWLQDMAERVDKLPQAIGQLSQRSKKIEIHDMCVGSEMFLPLNSNPKVLSVPHWARLEECIVIDHFDIIPEYLAAARAAREMLRFRNMLIQAHSTLRDDSRFHGLRYSRDTESNTARVIWASNFGFVPGAELVTEWQEVAWKHLGSKTLEIKISDRKSALEDI